MATEVARLIATLEADTKRFERDLRKAEDRLTGLERQTRKTDDSQRMLGKGFDKAKLAMTAFAVGAGVVAIDFMKDSVRAASDLNESMNALEKVYGANADGLKELGETAVDSFGMSQRAFNEFAVRFSAFGKSIARESGREVIEVVDEMAQRVADFASVHNLSMEEAAQVAQSTLAGETEAFRRFGGDVSAATVEMKALEMGVIGVGDELTEQEKQLVRYQLFMEQTANTAGDFADTSDQLANLLRRLEGTMENARAELGQAFIPALEKVLPILIDIAKEAGNFAIELLRIVGLLERGEALLLKWGIRTGAGADSTTALANAAREAAEELEAVFPLFPESEAVTVRRLEDAYQEVFDAFEGGLDPLLDFRRNFEMWVGILGLGEQEAEVLSDTLDRELASAIINTTNEAIPLREAMGDVDSELRNVNDAAGADRVLKQYADRLGDVADEGGRAADEQQRLAEGILAVATAQRAVADPIFRAADAVQRYEKALEAAHEDGILTNEEMLELAELAQDAEVALAEMGAGNVLNGIVSIATTLEKPVEMIADLLHDMGILNDTQWQIIVGLLVEASDADKALVNSAIRGGSGSRGAGSTRGAPAPVLQHGGFLGAGRPAIVGEAGPELFVPSQSGTVIPNISLTQNFQRVAGDNIEADISRGILLSGIGRFIESSPR